MKLKFLTTGIGSMPFTNAEQAVTVALSKVGNAPFWPQLPQLAFYEKMLIQFSEGMPAVVINPEKEKLYFDTASPYRDQLNEFYEAYKVAMDLETVPPALMAPPMTHENVGYWERRRLAGFAFGINATAISNPGRRDAGAPGVILGTGNGCCASMAITPKFSQGIYALENRLRSMGRIFPFIKVQTIGPCTFALSIMDENERAIYYNQEFRDVVVKSLAMKCRWQIQKFQPFARQVICFVDEPVLSAFGSAALASVQRNDVVALLAEVVEAIHADKAIAGIHCCGDTDWSMLVDAGADILSFDAYGYGESLVLYPEALRRHLKRGGMLAFGIIPTSKAMREENVESLEARLERLIDQLAATGIDKQLIIEQTLFTPSCGAGLLEPDDALRIFDLLDQLSKAMQEKYQ
jgi:hypothetical protein